MGFLIVVNLNVLEFEYLLYSAKYNSFDADITNIDDELMNTLSGCDAIVSKNVNLCTSF